MRISLKPRTWVEISRSALEANVRSLQILLTPATTLCAVVKANAYGHDITLTAGMLIEMGITHFAVDNIDEAFVVRRQSKDAVIFILGMTPAERFSEIVTQQFVQNIYDEEGLIAIIGAAVSQQAVALINIEIETGLHRLGAMPRTIVDISRAIKNNPRSVKLVGVSTHFSSSEDVNAQHIVDAQIDALKNAEVTFAAYDLHVPYIHAACSAAAILRTQSHLTMVRTGIALYGLWPSRELHIAVQRGRAFELRPVLSWKTTVAQVKDVPNGGGVGYNRTCIANRPMRIAVLPVGYYDGYDRHLSNHGVVLLSGRLCPVVGRICMNMMMVDVSDAPHVKKGDVATLLGREGMHSVTADELAERVGTINYEIVTRINPLIPRFVV